MVSDFVIPVHLIRHLSFFNLPHPYHILQGLIPPTPLCLRRVSDLIPYRVVGLNFENPETQRSMSSSGLEYHPENDELMPNITPSPSPIPRENFPTLPLAPPLQLEIPGVILTPVPPDFCRELDRLWKIVQITYSSVTAQIKGTLEPLAGRMQKGMETTQENLKRLEQLCRHVAQET